MTSKKTTTGQPGPGEGDALQPVPETPLVPPVEAEKAAPPETKAVEMWASELKVNPHLFAGAQRLLGWAQGRVLTRSQFEAGMDRMGALQVGVQNQKKEG